MPPAVSCPGSTPSSPWPRSARESLPPGIRQLSLTETICLKHPRKVGRDPTVTVPLAGLQAASLDGPASAMYEPQVEPGTGRQAS